MLDFFQGKIRFRINKEFVHYNPLPPIPKIDIQNLVTEFDHINWDAHFLPLLRKLKYDLRFMSRHSEINIDEIIALAKNKAHLSNQDAARLAVWQNKITTIVKNMLQAYITSIKERAILEGEIVDYEKLENYVKLIAKIQTTLDERNRTDNLFRLAVEGGNYCGPGKFEVAEDVYAQLALDNKEMPFKHKILHCLQDERTSWMERVYKISIDTHKTVGKVISWEDLHNRNIIYNCYGNALGIRMAAAENDELAIIDPIWQLYYSLRSPLEESFWKQHDLSSHIDVLRKSIGKPNLPRDEVASYWRGWVERQNALHNIDEQTKDALLDGLTSVDYTLQYKRNNKLYNRPIENRNRELSPDIAMLMLFDLGVLEIDQPNS